MSYSSFKEFNKTSNQKSEVKKPESKPVEQRGLPFVYLRKNKNGQTNPVAVRFLHSLDKAVDLTTHSVYDEEANTVSNLICEKNWQTDCKYCSNDMYSKNVKCIVSFVVSLVGKEWNIVDKETNEPKKGFYQTIRLTLIPAGRGGANFEAMKLASKEKIFTSRMWMLSKSQKIVKDRLVSVFNPPSILYEDDYKDMMGEDLPKYKLFEQALKISEMSEDEIFELIVKSFNNGKTLLDYLNKKSVTKEVDLSKDDYEEVDVF